MTAKPTVPRHLWLAAGRGDVDAVATCLQNGDAINAQEPNVRTRAISVAQLSSENPTCTFDFTYAKPVLLALQSRGTALYFAALNGHAAVVEHLLAMVSMN